MSMCTVFPFGKIVTGGRLWTPVLSILQDAKQTKILYRYLFTFKHDLIMHSRDSKVRAHCVRNFAISKPVWNRTLGASQNLNRSVKAERSLVEVINRDNRTGRTADNGFVVFMEKENEYFHDYLSNTIQYKPFFFPGCRNEDTFKSSTDSSTNLDQMLNNFNSTKISQDQLLSILKELTCLPTKQHLNLFLDPNFHQLCKCLLSQLTDMSNKAYFESMETMSRFNFRQCITSDLRDLRIMIAKSYDQENIARISDWDPRQLLLVADFYFHLRCSSMPWVGYLKRMFSTLFISKILGQLGNEEIVTLLLHVGLARQIGERELNDAVLKICQQIDSYTIEELGIVSLAYFKTNKPVKNTLFQEKIAAKLNSCIKDVEPICLSAILKCLQKSSNKIWMRYRPEMLQMMIDLQPSLSLRMSSLTPQTALHVISIFHNFKYISEKLISSFSVKLTHDDLLEWRFKDMALAVRLLAELSECFPNKTEILDRLTDELMSAHRESEVTSYLDYLARFLLGMAMAGVYSVPLLKWLFRPDSLAYFADHKINVYRDLYQLSESVRIECPSYSGPLLSDHLVKAQSKKSYICGRMPRIAVNNPGDGEVVNVSKRDQMMLQCIRALEWVLGGQQHLWVDFLLPHYQTADIELCTHFSQRKDKTGGLLSDPFDSEVCSTDQRVAVLLYAENAYYSLIRADGSVSHVLRGNYAMKRRQLKHLGFRIIEIPFYEFSQLEIEKKYEYVLNKVKLAEVLSKDYVNKLVLPTQ
ncbi:uncharacterized protein LOC121386771 isoform X2 [Gigantopelta aegis]|uniref:uncharacterized protein LOC121386771 isoform X2 n=1 Tax=Gigantopelta aegis TaxID=1735272 RepID=UPI001B8893A3|nr:uncharacterized protein LOC121386771 isoform X2 [Gigantopelta aegis]